MRAVCYLRVSVAERKNKNETIQNQRNFAERYFGNLGIDVFDWYVDNDVSGAIPMSQRPDGKRLIEDAEAGKFDTLYVYKIDRLGRDTVDSLTVARQLHGLGIDLSSMTEPFDTRGPQGEFTFTIFAAVAQMERANILERTMLGRLEAVQDGRWVGGKVPYGYTVIEKRLAPHPTEAENVRQMFDMFRIGKSLPTIAAMFGMDWTVVNRILQNRLYTGEATYRKWHQVKENGQYVRWEKQPEENHIRYSIPAIVPSDLFEACQRVRKNRPRTGKRSKKYRFLVSGKILCGVCEVPMQGNCCTKPNGVSYPYYRCPKCRLNIRASIIETPIWDDVKSWGTNPEVVLKMMQANQPEPRVDQTKALEKRMEDLGAEKDRAVGLAIKGLIDDERLEQELARIDRERKELAREVEELRSYEISRQNYEDSLQNLSRLFSSGMDTDAVQALVRSVRVLSRDRIQVDYGIATDLNVLTLVRNL